MKRFDKIKNIQKKNIILERLYIEEKHQLNEIDDFLTFITLPDCVKDNFQKNVTMSVAFVKTDGSVTVANSISFTSSTSLSVNVTLALGNYYVRIENPDGNAGRSTNNIITASTAPSWTTAAGSLGTIAGNFSGTVTTVAGTSDSTVSYSETTSVLTNASQANCALNSSTGAITTTDFGGSSTTPTTYNFTLRITDAEGQTADRAFSLTSSFGATGGGQFN